MKTIPVALVALLIGGVCQLLADTAIGDITLQSGLLQNGYQTITVNNFTGSTNGCEAFAPQYSVCNGVTIQNWQLEIDFTASVAGLTSPYIFNSLGSQDDISPTTVLDSYTGDSGNSWTLPLDVTNNCSPTCDAQITQIIFSGTIDQSTLLLYNGSPDGPYISEFLNTQNFSTTWTIPFSDYTSSPGNLYDSTDITVSQQPAVPEPATLWLVLVAGLTAGMLRRSGFFSTRRS